MFKAAVCGKKFIECCDVHAREFFYTLLKSFEKMITVLIQRWETTEDITSKVHSDAKALENLKKVSGYCYTVFEQVLLEEVAHQHYIVDSNGGIRPEGYFEHRNQLFGGNGSDSFPFESDHGSGSFENRPLSLKRLQKVLDHPKISYLRETWDQFISPWKYRKPVASKIGIADQNSELSNKNLERNQPQ